MDRTRLQVLIVGAMLCELWQPLAGYAKKNSQAAQEIPTAEVYGLSGERYEFYGTGGITVDESPRPGFIHSNFKTYRVRIDGGGGDSASGAAGANAQAAGFSSNHVEADFDAAPGCAYFATHTATCAMPSAADASGKEIVVCNAVSGGTITYSTKFGETISGNQSGVVTNSTAFQVDRFISDGKNWFKE